jgi:hypothetical protein
MGIFYVNTIFFIFFQMRDYNMYDNFTIASLVFSHIVLLVFVITLGLLIYKIVDFFISYPKLSENLKKASDIILQ